MLLMPGWPRATYHLVRLLAFLRLLAGTGVILGGGSVQLYVGPAFLTPYVLALVAVALGLATAEQGFYLRDWSSDDLMMGYAAQAREERLRHSAQLDWLMLSAFTVIAAGTLSDNYLSWGIGLIIPPVAVNRWSEGTLTCRRALTDLGECV